MARSVDLGDELDKQVALAARLAGVSGNAFIKAACRAAVLTCSVHDISLASAIMAADRARLDDIRSMGRRHALPVDAA